MKEKIILFVIGVLVGAVISTGAFYIYTTMSTNCSNDNNTQMNGGQPPSMPNGQSGQSNSSNQPPSMPGQNNTQNSNA